MKTGCVRYAPKVLGKRGSITTLYCRSCFKFNLAISRAMFGKRLSYLYVFGEESSTHL